MSELVKAYIEEVAEGVVPNPNSAEAKEYRAWSWAREQLERIEADIAAGDRYWQMVDEYYMEQENGEMYR